MVRNFLTAFGVVSVFAVFFFIIRPDWIKQIASSPGMQGPTMMTKVNARLSADRLMAHEMPTAKGGLFKVEPQSNGEDLTSRLVEDVGEDLPSRNMPYLLVVNKSTNSMRYCRLSSSVRKASLRGTLPPDVKIQEVANTPGGPYQVIIWVPSAIDLQMEFEVMVPAPARS